MQNWHHHGNGPAFHDNMFLPLVMNTQKGPLQMIVVTQEKKYFIKECILVKKKKRVGRGENAPLYSLLIYPGEITPPGPM